MIDRLGWLVLVSASVVQAKPFPTERLAVLLNLRPTRMTPTAVAPPPLSCRTLGTMVDVTEQRSLAMVQCAARWSIAWVGAEIDDGEVVAIEHGRVLVRRGERLEVLTQAPPPAASSPVVAATPTPAVKPTRAKVNELIADPRPLMNDVRMLPAIVNGRWAGLKAAWVKDGSWPAQLGLKTGDVLRSVNGVSLDGLENAMSVLSTLSTAKEVAVVIDRSGQPVTQRFKLE